MNAGAYLKDLGWRGEGFSLDTTDRGLAKPLLVQQRNGLDGIGAKKHDFSNQWWLSSFDKSLKGVGTTGAAAPLVEIQPPKTKLYSGFVKGETLSSTITLGEQKEKSSEPISSITSGMAPSMATVGAGFVLGESPAETAAARYTSPIITSKQRRERPEQHEEGRSGDLHTCDTCKVSFPKLKSLRIHMVESNHGGKNYQPGGKQYEKYKKSKEETENTAVNGATPPAEEEKENKEKSKKSKKIDTSEHVSQELPSAAVNGDMPTEEGRKEKKKSKKNKKADTSEEISLELPNAAAREDAPVPDDAVIPQAEAKKSKKRKRDVEEQQPEHSTSVTDSPLDNVTKKDKKKKPSQQKLNRNLKKALADGDQETAKNLIAKGAVQVEESKKDETPVAQEVIDEAIAISETLEDVDTPKKKKDKKDKKARDANNEDSEEQPAQPDVTHDPSSAETFISLTSLSDAHNPKSPTSKPPKAAKTPKPKKLYIAPGGTIDPFAIDPVGAPGGNKFLHIPTVHPKTGAALSGQARRIIAKKLVKREKKAGREAVRERRKEKKEKRKRMAAEKEAEKKNQPKKPPRSEKYAREKAKRVAKREMKGSGVQGTGANSTPVAAAA